MWGKKTICFNEGGISWFLFKAQQAGVGFSQKWYHNVKVFSKTWMKVFIYKVEAISSVSEKRTQTCSQELKFDLDMSYFTVY